jgi:hypothetical protein
MARRLSQTTFDYVVIALSPALIMTLVGSLVFFLLRVFYQGQFNERIHWVMACFVFAAVLIGRISIEEGWERAMPFGAALGLAVWVAMNSFLTVQGSWVDQIGWLVNALLIALVWWCAHRLTWDCTVIDDEEDASGEGLLQIAGLERRPGEAAQGADPSKQAAGADDNAAFERAVEGTTSRPVPSGWWQRYVEHQHRPHAPGVWVVYFSLAALPLFGVGQWFIPETNVAGRRGAFWLLAIYVASGLGLLLTTSFLGLRRYLRQRRIEMPIAMANLWLAIGASLVVVLLAFATLLPRPSAEYAISRLPFSVGSPDQRASNVSPTSQEGAEGEKPGSARDIRPEDEREPSDKAAASNPSDSSQPADRDAATGPGGTKPKSEQTSSASDPTASKSSGSSDSKNPSKAGKSSEQGQSEPAKNESRQTAQEGGKAQGERANETRDQRADAGTKSDAGTQPATKPPGEKSDNPSSSTSEPNAADAAPSQPEQSPSYEPRLPTPDVGPLAEIFQWLFYGVVIAGVAYGIWRFRGEIARAVRDFLAGLRDLLSELFGGRRVRSAADDERMHAVEFPPQPFASYADPFADGTAQRLSREELVRYSFEAFEAWSREHGTVRNPDVTPHELTRVVGKRNPQIANDARNLAELYARAAYADGRVPASAVEQLRHLWQTMRAATSAAW